MTTKASQTLYSIKLKGRGRRQVNFQLICSLQQCLSVFQMIQNNPTNCSNKIRLDRKHLRDKFISLLDGLNAE